MNVMFCSLWLILLLSRKLCLCVAITNAKNAMKMPLELAPSLLHSLAKFLLTFPLDLIACPVLRRLVEVVALAVIVRRHPRITMHMFC